MLSLKIKAKEDYDSEKNEFYTIKEQTLNLEHSLIALSKWEGKWKKPFLSDKALTREELLDYIRCMAINQVDDTIFSHLNDSEISQIAKYIEDPMTATTISNLDPTKGNKKEIMTAEIFYYYMTALNIPFECQKWHLNRLYTLIQVCAIKNQAEQPKMGKKATGKYNHALNQARRAKTGSRG